MLYNDLLSDFDADNEPTTTTTMSNNETMPPMQSKSGNINLV
jgi:hypothetical protein